MTSCVSGPAQCRRPSPLTLGLAWYHGGLVTCSVIMLWSFKIWLFDIAKSNTRVWRFLKSGEIVQDGHTTRPPPAAVDGRGVSLGVHVLFHLGTRASGIYSCCKYEDCGILNLLMLCVTCLRAQSCHAQSMPNRVPACPVRTGK